MIDGYQPKESYFGQIRGVGLLPDEKVTSIFSPDYGIIQEPPSEGRLLVATTQRLISYSQGQNSNETALAPVEELKGVVVKSESTRTTSLSQLMLLIGGGILIYLVAGYWVTGEIDPVWIPLINIDFSALVVLAAVIGGVWFVIQHYFAKEQGLITFQGSSWILTFPLVGEKAEDEAYLLINTLFAARQSQARNGYHTAPAQEAAPTNPQSWSH